MQLTINISTEAYLNLKHRVSYVLDHTTWHDLTEYEKEQAVCGYLEELISLHYEEPASGVHLSLGYNLWRSK